MNTQEAGMFLGNQLGMWSGYVVDIMKKPVAPIDPKHVMVYSLSVPVGIRGTKSVDITVEENFVIIYFK